MAGAHEAAVGPAVDCGYGVEAAEWASPPPRSHLAPNAKHACGE